MLRLERILWSLVCGSVLALPGCYSSDDGSTEPPVDVSTDEDVADVDAEPLPDSPMVAMYGAPGP